MSRAPMRHEVAKPQLPLEATDRPSASRGTVQTPLAPDTAPRATPPPPSSARSDGRRAPRASAPRRVYRVLRNLVIVAILLAVVLAGVLLGIDNQTPLTVRFLDRESAAWPVVWWLTAAFALGLLVGLALCAASLVRGRLNERRLRWSLRQHQREIDGLNEKRA